MAKGTKKRGAGEGTIYYREAKRLWCAQVTLEDGAGAAPRRKTIYGKTQREVREKLTLLSHRRDRGVVLADGQMTVGQWLDEWLAMKRRGGIEDSTWIAYEQNVRIHLKPGLGKMKLVKLTPRHVQAFYTERLAGPRSSSTVKHMHEVLHNALEDAVQMDLIARNVSEVPNPPKLAKRPMVIYDSQQVGRLLRTVADDRLSALVVLVLNTAMREGELIALKWGDVDLRSGVVQVQAARKKRIEGGFKTGIPKTESSRRAIPLTPEALAALKAHRKRYLAELSSGAGWPKHDLVFTRADGTQLEHWHVRSLWYRWVREAKLPFIRFHDLRHTAASWLLAKGVPPNVVQLILGHSDPATTMRIYGHVMPRGTTDAAKVMSQLMQEALRSADSDQAQEAQEAQEDVD